MRLIDHAMNCCGMVTAEEILSGVRRVKEEFTCPVFGPGRTRWVITDEAWDEHFQQIEEHQKKHRRSCAMMTLVPGHRSATEAELRGYKKVFQFYNPNSGNMNGVYVKALWSIREQYESDISEGRYTKPPKNDLWVNGHGSVIVENGKRIYLEEIEEQED